MGGDLAVPEIFRISVAVAKIVVDQNRGLAGQFNPLAAFVARNHIVQPDHIRTCLVEFDAVFAASAAWKFLALGTHLPPNRGRKFAAATGADHLLRLVFFPFRIECALVHS